MKDTDNSYIKLASNGLEINVKEVLKQVSIFSNIVDEEGVLEFMKRHDLLELKSNEYVIREGEVGACAYVALSGILEVSRKSWSGDDIVVATFNVDFDKVSQENLQFPLFGESGLVATESRTATIKTRSDVILLKIDYEDLAKVSDNFPKIGLHVFREMCYILQARLKNSNSNVVALFQAYLDTMNEDLMRDDEL